MGMKEVTVQVVEENNRTTMNPLTSSSDMTEKKDIVDPYDTYPLISDIDGDFVHTPFKKGEVVMCSGILAKLILKKHGNHVKLNTVEFVKEKEEKAELEDIKKQLQELKEAKLGKVTADIESDEPKKPRVVSQK